MILPSDAIHFTTTNAWHSLVTTYQLNVSQQKQLHDYVILLLEWNALFNITAITDPEKIIQDHLYDSLALSRAYPLENAHGMADIGSGGGLPGIPLKIKYPQLPIVLVEVTQKKITFLNHVIAQLALPLIEVCPLDWRTFIRKKNYAIDVICARASLRPDELSRVFKADSQYDEATVVYWASSGWIMGDAERPYFDHEYAYTVADKKRKLVFFAKPGSTNV